MKLGEDVHLTYCTNIHPGETLDEVRALLARHVVAVRDRLAPGCEFGVGLRLSARAAAELAAPAALAALREQLRRDGLYVFTLNGFPYGAFQGTRVKEEVYRPDWRDPERLRYTNQLADLLAALLPDDAALQGSLSTVPGAFKAALTDPGDVARIVEQLLRHVAHLVGLRRRSGRRIALALEPEPLCLLETIDETVEFFATHLHSAQAARRLAELAGLDEAAAATALREHLGVCLDLCHAAIEFEDAAACLDRLAGARIAVAKLQVSAGLMLPEVDDSTQSALRRFDDGVYLHQVVQRQGDALTRFADLADAFAARGAAMSAASPAANPCEWRVHFHVPIFLEQLPPFASTQAFVRDVLARQRRQPVSRHLEVETYTWDLLPVPYRDGDVDAAVARELNWVRAQLGIDVAKAAA